MPTTADFDRAVALIDDGRWHDALPLLTELSQAAGHAPAVHAKLGLVQWELGRLDEAIAAFRKAIALAPTSETASLGLFHCLWEYGRRDAAFDEMKRFLSLAESDEYREILRGINDPS
jgi:Flp pilus assembly protein TadD